MKPLGPPANNTIQSREETTSTCVMWDGPNISFDCLGVQICEGESINPIVYRSFVNLCNILEELNIDTLNLTCLGNLINTTRSLNEVFNLLIDRLCIEADKVNQLEDTITNLYNANLPFCLQDFNDQLTITKLPLPEYYQKVAAKICLYLADIAILENQYELSAGHYFYDQIALLQIEIDNLCNAASLLVTPICTNNNPSVEISSIFLSGPSDAQITTLTPHGYNNGDIVTITGVIPNSYNGIWEVTVIDAYTFSITTDSAFDPYFANGTTAIATEVTVATGYENLEALYCLLKNYTGSFLELSSVIRVQCTDLSNQKRLSGTGLMSTIPGWTINPTSVAESMQNLWLTICDLRNAVKKIEETCISKDCLDANNDPLCCAKCALVNDALGDGSNIVYTTIGVHDLVIGDKINISGAMLPVGYNVTGAFITAVTPTTFTIVGTTIGVSSGISILCSKIN